ncbi:MAG: aspartate ammonia-lyase [Tissierellia bacterium]|nr:aspartate ammonia-lyase [Tissierellia bacterium]
MDKKDLRVEHDSLGEINVPKDAYYGVHSQRAKENFPITGVHTDREIIRGAAEVKKACAITNFEVGMMDEKVKDAISHAADKVMTGEYDCQFIVDPIQGGAGTSHNMNANEVIANLAIEELGGELGDYSIVHPNDHVNFGQSTNDVFPTSGKLAIIRYIDKTKAELEKLIGSVEKKAEEFDGFIKMGRTQMQDAIPIRLGQEFGAYAQALKRDMKRLDSAREAMSVINLGATAIGTGLNADADYVKKVVPNLAKVTGLDLTQAEDLVDGTQNLDGFVYVSGVLKALAVSLSKMSNDLRLMSSGPRTGFGEIFLPAKQAGSSIMPGKVNPVIPEVVTQVAFSVIGNDMTIAMAAEGGQLELNAFEPVIFYKIFESFRTLEGAMYTLRVNCIDGIEANPERMENLVENSVGVITAIVPHVGYEAAAKVAKEAIATGKPVRQLVLDSGIVSEEDLNMIMDLYSMTEPGISAEELLKE